VLAGAVLDVGSAAVLVVVPAGAAAAVLAAALSVAAAAALVAAGLVAAAVLVELAAAAACRPLCALPRAPGEGSVAQLASSTAPTTKEAREAERCISGYSNLPRWPRGRAIVTH